MEVILKLPVGFLDNLLELLLLLLKWLPLILEFLDLVREEEDDVLQLLLIVASVHSTLTLIVDEDVALDLLFSKAFQVIVHQLVLLSHIQHLLLLLLPPAVALFVSLL